MIFCIIMLSDKREMSTFLSFFLLIIIIFFRGSPSHGVAWWWPPVSASLPWPPPSPCPWSSPWPWLLACSAIFFLFYSLKKILAIVEFFKIEFLSDIFDWLFSYLLNSTSFLMPSIVFSGCAKSNNEKRSPRKEVMTELNCFQMLFNTLGVVLVAGAASVARSSMEVWFSFINGV